MQESQLLHECENFYPRKWKQNNVSVKIRMFNFLYKDIYKLIVEFQNQKLLEMKSVNRRMRRAIN